MTLLQTRVTEPVAKGFRKSAAERGLTPSALLADLVKLTSGGRRKGGWKSERRLAGPPPGGSNSHFAERGCVVPSSRSGWVHGIP